ncbi:hypothetical protein BJV82DRAFT_665276 [Fennellomyces sp. T-0311]|nr:hypothetical protein BJV82DRAFT_665276 [Fennellomyces sp. T-0311]
MKLNVSMLELGSGGCVHVGYNNPDQIQTYLNSKEPDDIPFKSLTLATKDVAAAVLTRTNDVEKAKEYIHRVRAPCTETRKLLDVILVILHTIDTSTFLLYPANIDAAKEYDFTVQVWNPLLKGIVDVHGALRTNVGEPSPKIGSVALKRLYGEIKCDSKRIYSGRGGEAKNNLGGAILHTSNEHKASRPSSFFVQTNGATTHIGSPHLSKFIFVVNVIYKLERNATFIRKSVDSVHDRHCNSLAKSIYRQESTTSSDWVYVVWPTYYDPPEDVIATAKLSLELFGPKSPASFKSTPRLPASMENVDEFGWVEKDGRFFNVYTSSYADHHPLTGIANGT